jgi:hypothetical protein
VDGEYGKGRREQRGVQNFGGRPDGKRQFGRFGCKPKDNIKRELKDTGWKGVDMIRLAHDQE